MGFPKGTILVPLTERFDRKVLRDESGCWLWQGFIDKAGYGRLHGSGRDSPAMYAHRYAYERFSGLSALGFHIHHRCRVRHCVNPEHLEALEASAHSKLADHPPRVSPTRCPAGHEYATEGYYHKGNYHHCKACRRNTRDERKRVERSVSRDGRQTGPS